MNSLLQLLWLTFAITPTTAVLVAVYTKEAVTVPCNQSVTLHCNITYREGLSVKQLYWFREDKEIKMCEVTESWDNNTHLNEECNYTPNTQLSLTLLQVQKYDEGKYICKLRSNRGVKESSTTVSLQGSPCYNKAKYRNNDEGPTCVFTGVHPDGEVHWFHGATNVSNDATNNTKQVEARGALTVTSSLKRKRVADVYKCVLWIPSTGESLASLLTEKVVRKFIVPNSSFLGAKSGSGTFEPAWKLLGCMFLFYSTVFLV